MKKLFHQLTELRSTINRGQYASPGENALADHLLELVDIVANLALEVEDGRRPGQPLDMRQFANDLVRPRG